MALIHKQPVNSKLFKCHYIVFPRCVIQFFKPCLERFPCFLHLLNGIAFPVVGFCLLYGKLYLADLPFYHGFLTLD